ncbi:hypothetical protein HNP40_001187 [Mycobacteroides chelonae]|nr:hypothetical protein [Mycobacteroides chelonae]
MALPDSATVRISTAWRVPAQMTTESGVVRMPRTRATYSDTRERNVCRPRGFPARRDS